ncbi:MAG: hypothetical protein ACJA1A_001131 [Saprospiraceae bacterium]|jgi:hypothetical protein
MNRIISLLFLLVFSQQLTAQSSIQSHMMGHSLMDHASSTQQTKIAYWINQLALEDSNVYESAGQFGGIWQFANFNPTTQWGSPSVPASWDEDFEAYANADLNNFMFTIYNYVQDLPPDVVYYTLPSSVLTASERLVDSVKLYQGDNNIFIYENWPDMGPFADENPFNPTTQEFDDYNDYTLGDFHDWWIDLHDLILTSRPTCNIRMIPVGPMIAEMMGTAPYNTIPANQLYEDNAPHGRETIYFLAGLATYMAIYGEKAPSTYIPPNTVLPEIVNNYATIVDDFWDYMVTFNDDNGDSRVFVNTSNPPDDIDGDGVNDPQDNCVNTINPNQADYDNDGIGDLCDTPENKVIIDQGVLYQDDAEGILLKGRNGACYLIYIDENGQLITEERPCPD